ncbi:MAG TPA: phosphoribosyl-AMP cyclohydrolase [Chloroflexia bacterium]|nr:phosphoribosyl-AMP cyclohydrolase [Chloroflexia bacterium]
MTGPPPDPRAGWIALLHFGDDGLVPAVVQATVDGRVLLVGSMNREALARTLASGQLWLWSRSRQRLWLKGETSGHFQRVDALYVNCELNSLLIQVTSRGPVCHAGYPTCFYRRVAADGSLETVVDQAFTPDRGDPAPAGAE